MLLDVINLHFLSFWKASVVAEKYANYIQRATSHRLQHNYILKQMETLMNRLEQLRTWKQSMRKSCRRNKLSIEIVSYFTPTRFKACFPHFISLHEKKAQSKCQRWLQNELKAFQWACLVISCVEDRIIAEFEDTHWTILFKIFQFKSPVTLMYQAKKMINESKSQKPWKKQQETLFMELMKNQDASSNHWNQKARQLYQLSNGQFLRSGKQIRQKWLNHLDPSKNHGQWSEQEEKIMIETILKDGRKWSKIAKTIQTNRTEHMVKNRYKTIISKLKKAYPGVKDEDELLKKFVEQNQYPSRPLQVETIERGIQSLQFKTEHEENENKKDFQQIQNYFEQRKQDRPEDPDQHEKRKDKLNISNYRNSSMMDLAQVYSPWVVGIPSTPAFSPSIGYFLNLSNFSALDNVYSGNFYNPEKHQ